jgi:methyl-accepting chemotaxis protein
MNAILLEWLSPQGIIAAGVLWGLIQQFITSRRTAHAVKVLAVSTEQAHALAQTTAEKVDTVVTTLEEVKTQTNGMSHRLETLAGEAGEARGAARAEAEAKKP